MAGSKANGASRRHVPDKPAHVTPAAEPYWRLFTRTYDFEDVEAPRLAMLCNLYALAEECQSMSFSADGKPLVLISRGVRSGDGGDDQMVPNPFLEALGGIQREIERVSAALGILIREKSPVNSSFETPVDRAARRRAERSGKDD